MEIEGKAQQIFYCKYPVFTAHSGTNGTLWELRERAFPRLLIEGLQVRVLPEEPIN